MQETRSLDRCKCSLHARARSRQQLVDNPHVLQVKILVTFLTRPEKDEMLDSNSRLKMAQLIVRNIDEVLVRLLKIRAAEHRHSPEAEHREILRQTLQPGGDPTSFDAFLLEMPDVGAHILSPDNPPMGGASVKRLTS